MTDTSETLKKYEEIGLLFKWVEELPLEKQTELLCRYGIDHLPLLLFHLILHMSKEQKQTLTEELLNPADADQRAHERLECVISTDYLVNDRVHRNFVKDISEGGVFIETAGSTELEVGDKMVQSLSMLNEQILFKFTGEIVRIDKKGLGVKFVNLTPYQLEMLRSIIKKFK